MPAIINKSEQMYVIFCTRRNGFLTWDHDGNRYVMAFTTSDKAEEYNHVVMDHMPGEIRIIKQRQSMDFAREMVAGGVHWMIIDYPVINDKVEAWNPIPRELGRDYGLVDLKKLVDFNNGHR